MMQIFLGMHHLNKSEKNTSQKNGNELNHTDSMNNYSSSESGLEALFVINQQYNAKDVNLFPSSQIHQFTSTNLHTFVHFIVHKLIIGDNQTVRKSPTIKAVDDTVKKESIQKYHMENDKSNDLYASIRR